MPVVTVNGIPEVPKIMGKLHDLVDVVIPNAVASVDELDLTADQVSVFIPRDLLPHRMRTDVVARIEFLYANPDVRTLEVRQKLADSVGQALRQFAVDNMQTFLPLLVEVFVQTIDPEASGIYITSVKDKDILQPPALADTELGSVDAPFCDICGHIAVHEKYNRWKCLNCGNTMLKSMLE